MMMRTFLNDFFFTTRIPLFWELTILILIKCAALYFIWWMSFSNPQGKTLTAERVSQHLIQSPLEEGVTIYDGHRR